VRPAASKFDEETLTLEFMEKHGINNVRGGSYVQIELPKEQVQEIERKLASVNNACFKCGQQGHTVAECGSSSSSSEEEEVVCARCGRDTHDASSCYAKTHVDGSELRLAKAKKEKKREPKKREKKQRQASPVQCQRCGRDSHDASSCYAKTVLPGFVPRGRKSRRTRMWYDECYGCGRPAGYDTEDCGCYHAQKF
jgi:hypothetical protein